MDLGISNFKNQRRGQRIQMADEQFGKGMYHTNAPLNPGYIREIVNYDFKDGGEILAPRPAVRPETYDIYEGAMDFNSDMVISDGKFCTEEDLNVMQQVIVGVSSDTKLTGTNLYTGSGYVGAGLDSELTYAVLNSAPTDYVIFKRPQYAEIHREPIIDTTNVATQVGCFAYNNNYFYFKNNGKLCKTSYSAGVYLSQELSPRAITPKEAVTWGYNMYASNPYDFANGHSAASIQLLGLTPYDENNQILMSPQTNQTVTLKTFYDVVNGAVYTMVWEWKEAMSSTWSTIKSEDVTFAANTTLTASFSSPVTNVMVRISGYRWVNGVKESVPINVLTVGITFNKQNYGTTANIAPTTYSLYTATGMCYWKNRLVCWGVKEDKTLLFMSEVNNPEYFPYPNNVELLQEPIIHAIPFVDDLLVFTTTSLTLLTLSEDGTTWTKKFIQGNLNISEWDVHMIQVMKNMVFFRSGDYFYMVVPSKMNAGSLTIAPISKNMENFFDNFKTNITNTVDFIYGYKGGLDLVHYYNYIDFDDICNVYVFKTDSGLYLNYMLLYNITSRSWRSYMVESQQIRKPFRQDATKKGILISLWNFSNKPCLQVFSHDQTLVQDYYLPDGLIDVNDAPTEFAAIHTFRNYQMLDSGYREHDSDFKRRFREFQLKFNNISQTTLRFYTDFFIDEALRRSMNEYTVVHETDPESPNYGVITVERNLVDPSILPGTTMLGETQNDINLWQLDVSQFPNLSLWKVRIPISGKGYAGRIRMVSFNEERYELLNLIWVFRPLYSR